MNQNQCKRTSITFTVELYEMRIFHVTNANNRKTPMWKINGAIGKNTVEKDEETALKKKNRNKRAHSMKSHFNLTYLLPSLITAMATAIFRRTK